MSAIAKTVGLFLVAAVCEIGGAYLVWQWRNGGRPAWFALVGVAALFSYALVQAAHRPHISRAALPTTFRTVRPIPKPTSAAE